jgi:hypothetical protein
MYETIIIFIVFLSIGLTISFKYELDLVYTIDFIIVLCIAAKVIDSYMFFLVILLLFTKYHKKEVSTSE